MISRVAALVCGVSFMLFLSGMPHSANYSISGDAAKNLEYRIERYRLKEDVIRRQVTILNGTFLGNSKRNYYGNSAPSKLNILYRIYLGEGETVVSKAEGRVKWSGAGWTGQPLVFVEDSIKYLVIGTFDHNLKKINLKTHEIVWQYPYEDVIKGTGSIWYDRKAKKAENRYIIMQGSRMGVGNSLSDKEIASYRAVSLKTGKEVWKMNVKRTDSYSRDVDGTALILNDTAYIGLENGLFSVFNPSSVSSEISGDLLQPLIYKEIPLYAKKDIAFHGGNLVTESSPCLLKRHIYITSGSGHVYGYNLDTRTIDWDFYTGSDIDGSPVVTSDNCLLVAIEKQYIKGNGGVLKLDPSKPPSDAVVWFFPVKDKLFAKWNGGIIGSVSVNDNYNDGSFPSIAAFTAIDGNLYVVNYKSAADARTVTGFDGEQKYLAPQLLFKYNTGPAISTPIIIGNKIIAATYNGIYLFSFDKYMKFTLLDKALINCEATPVAIDGCIYIASRDGFLYCLGE
jgi:outer membrane protein assembly factor BamB